MTDILNFKGTRFPIDMILVCIRRHSAYPRSYRHLKIMEERGVLVDHSSINRWAILFLPMIRWRRNGSALSPAASAGMRRTSRSRGAEYLYRAVDKQRKTVGRGEAFF